jgi:hypothetical protein
VQPASAGKEAPVASVVYSLRGLRALCAASWLLQAFDSQAAFFEGLGYFSAFSPGPGRALHAAGSLLAAVIPGCYRQGKWEECSFPCVCLMLCTVSARILCMSRPLGVLRLGWLASLRPDRAGLLSVTAVHALL